MNTKVSYLKNIMFGDCLEQTVYVKKQKKVFFLCYCQLGTMNMDKKKYLLIICSNHIKMKSSVINY